MSSKQVQPAGTPASPIDYETEHVHTIYDSIATHFSSTRYKPWPVVAAFLSSIPAGWVGLDSGTGNGKYLPLPVDRPGQIWTLGLDRSIKLLEIAKNAGGKERECIHGDALGLCWREGVFDYVISIATIHHLSTPERRRKAIQCLLRCLSPAHGRGLIYVWATQQDELSKRTLPSAESISSNADSIRGQDVFVPWTLTGSLRPSETDVPRVEEHDTKQTGTAVYQRYYHMFDSGELRALICSAAEEIGIECHAESVISNDEPHKQRRCMSIVKDDWERSNYYVEFQLWEG